MLSLATKFIPVRDRFESASRAGFRAAEFWLDEKWLLKADQIAEIASHFPFRYALHFPNQGPLSDAALHDAVGLFHRLKCTAIVIHQPMFDRYAKPLLAIDPLLDLAIENHVLDLTGIDRWAEESPGLTLDVEHLWKYTLHDGPLSSLLLHVDRILEKHHKKLHHVHLPGYQPGGDEHHPASDNPEMVTEILSRLDACGFSKLVVSEADIPFQTEEFLKKDVLLFDRWQKSRS